MLDPISPEKLYFPSRLWMKTSLSRDELERRRMGLQRFFQQVAQIPVCLESEAVQAFFSASGTMSTGEEVENSDHNNIKKTEVHPPEISTLTKEEQDKLRCLVDRLQDQDHVFVQQELNLVRFLRAREWNVDHAAKALKKTIE